jgi:hypothetical protein
LHKGKSPIENSSVVDISSTLQLNFTTSPSFEEYHTHPVSTPIGSPEYISCKSEEPSPLIPYQPSSYFSPHEENKDSLLIFQNPLYNFPLITMVATGGGGGRVVEGGGGGAPGGGAGCQGPAPPPRVFAKVAARYAPLVLPIPLHDLPENFIKNLPKFTGEGDLTTAEHINLFDQFADILGLKHEDVYSRIFIQTFKGQVRTWFWSLPTGSILSYDALEDSFLRQQGERKDHLYYLTEFGL